MTDKMLRKKGPGMRTFAPPLFPGPSLLHITAAGVLCSPQKQHEVMIPHIWTIQNQEGALKTSVRGGNSFASLGPAAVTFRGLSLVETCLTIKVLRRSTLTFSVLKEGMCL